MTNNVHHAILPIGLIADVLNVSGTLRRQQRNDITI
jgi:hypothetical protein